MLLVVVYGAMPCHRPYPTMAAPLADDDYYESQGLVCRGRSMYERGEAFGNIHVLRNRVLGGFDPPPPLCHQT